LKHPAGAKKSDRQFAEHVGVSDRMVNKYRDQFTAKDSQSDQRTGKDGRTINTANIGRKAEAVEVERLYAAEAKGRQGSRTDLKEPCGAGASKNEPPKAREQAAKALGIGARSVQAAKSVMHEERLRS
jgi:hypothetical protein